MMTNTTILIDPTQPLSLGPPRDGFLMIQDETFIESVFMTSVVILGSLGTITNALNIKTFINLGTDDGVTVSLLALSISDFGLCLLCTMAASSFFSHNLELQHDIVFYVDRKVPFAFLVTIIHSFYSMTSLTITYLAVVRCMCVTMPLQFKNVFTRSRSLIILVTFALISVSGYIPVLSEMGVRLAFDARVNQTRYLAWLSFFRAEIKDVVYLIFDIIFTTTTQVVLIVCAIILAHGLRQSGKFQKSTKSTTDDEQPKKEAFKLSGKELRVVQQVMLICTISIVCAIPKVFSAFYTIAEPEFAVGKKLHNLYYTMNDLRRNFELINSTTTFFIYYTYNSRFKSLCFTPSLKKMKS